MVMMLRAPLSSCCSLRLACCCAFLLLSIAAAGGAAGANSRWPWPHRGDVRAVIILPSANELGPTDEGGAAAAAGPVAALVQWRRRDAQPGLKGIIVTDVAGEVLSGVSTPVITKDHGVIVFTPSAGANQTYFVYYMPYTQSGVGQAHFAWDDVDSSLNYSSVGSFSAKSGVKTRQEFTLPAPATASKFRWTCLSTWKVPSYQGMLAELEFRTSAGWLTNHATSDDHKPVVAASSEQPEPWPSGGHAWQAMDGDVHTLWDPRSSPSSLSLDFGKEITVEAIGIVSCGDVTHDIKAFKLEAAPSAPPGPASTPWQQLPRVPASRIHIESRDDFHNIIPMGLPANSSELAGLMATHPSPDGVWVFPESRDFKVMMEDRIPYRWVERGPSTNFSASVRRGEWYYFQLAVYTATALTSITLSELVVKGGGVTMQAQCLNTMGSTSLGEDVSPTQRPERPGFTSFLVSAEAGTVKALWIGVKIPTTLQPETVLSGTATLGLEGAAGRSTARQVSVALTVSAESVSYDQGFSDLQSYSRLSWLNSKYAIDDEVIAPFTALQVASSNHGVLEDEVGAGGFAVSLLNRRVMVAADGLPASISVTRPTSAHGVIMERQIDLLAKPISLDLWKGGAKLPVTVRTAAKVWRTTPASVSWSSAVVAGPAVLSLNATIHMDGYIDFAVALSAATPADDSFELDDIQLCIEWKPQPKDQLYYMGMNQLGQAFESNTRVAWKWSMARQNNFMWAGSPSAGLKVKLKDDNDPRRDAAIPQYSVLPLSWANAGQGGVNISANPGAPLGASLVAYTGKYTLMPAVEAPLTNGSRVFRWDMSVTPFKARNESQHWNLRHFQVGYPGSTFTSAEDVHKTGATVINIHQGVDTMINPFINYPFIPESVALLANYTKIANDLGMRVKFYYTVRELSNHAAEIWAMRQLGNEIYSRPTCGSEQGASCGGAAWLQEQLGSTYGPAWFDQLQKPNGADAAIAQAGTAGRWLNYYIEGLRQSVAESPFINGIYYDGILFDRFTMLRVRKTLERNSKQHEPLIDMHTGNDFTGSGRTDAVQYANHWAYVDSLWIGEGFSYDSPPNQWLLEISGMPFGVFSDMLGTPNKYRGMLFGSTGRFGCSNPTPMWLFWDEFGLQECDMVGWWEPEVPVMVAATGADGPIHATAYVSKGKKTLLSLGSWSSTNATVALSFDWAMLGLTESAVKTITAPAIPNFQPSMSWKATEKIPVAAAKGWLLVIEQE